MNPFLLASRERLSAWKTFRTSLPALSEPEQLRAVAAFWAQAPIGTYAYDADDCSKWPTPWEMMADGSWCRNSVAIGMEFTLRLSGWDPARLCLQFIRDTDLSEEILVLIVDGNRWLNYEYREVVSVPETKWVPLFSCRHNGKNYVCGD
jgi:hypothetical protein